MKFVIIGITLLIGVFGDRRLFIVGDTGTEYYPELKLSQGTIDIRNTNISKVVYHQSTLQTNKTDNIVYPSKEGRILFLRQEGNTSHITRCFRLKFNSFRFDFIKNYTFTKGISDFDFSEISEFSELLESSGHKVELLNMAKNIGNQRYAYGNFECKGFYLESSFPLEYSKSMISSISSHFSSPIETLDISSEDNFFGRFYFSGDSLSNFHFELNKVNPQTTSLSFELKEFLQGPSGLFNFAHKSGNDVYDTSFDFKGKSKKTRGKFIQANSSFTKELVGTGLHRRMKVNFSLEADKEMFSAEIQKGKCSLAMIDVLGVGEYIDIEEFSERKDLKLHTFGLIDIELPDYLSSQHVYIVEKKTELVEREEISYNKLRISTEFEYPFHLRYGKPSQGDNKEGDFTHKPTFYFDCLVKSMQIDHIFTDFFDELVYIRVSKMMTRVNITYPPTFQQTYNVNIGNSNHFSIVLLSTLIITLGSTLYLALIMLRASSETKQQCSKVH